MHECKGEEVLNANLVGASSGRGKGSMKVSLYGTFQMFIADGGWWRLWERPGGGGQGTEAVHLKTGKGIRNRID